MNDCECKLHLNQTLLFLYIVLNTLCKKCRENSCIVYTLSCNLGKLKNKVFFFLLQVTKCATMIEYFEQL